MPRRNDNARSRNWDLGGPGWLTKGEDDPSATPRTPKAGRDVGRAAVLSAGNVDPEETMDIGAATGTPTDGLVPDDKVHWTARDHHYARGDYPVDDSPVRESAPLPPDAKIPEPVATFVTEDGQVLTGNAALDAMFGDF